MRTARMWMAVAVVGLVASAASAGVVLSEPFDTDTADAKTEPAYAYLTWDSHAINTVTSGVLFMRSDSQPAIVQTPSGYLGNIVVSAEISRGYSQLSDMGLVLGSLYVSFYPANPGLLSAGTIADDDKYLNDADVGFSLLSYPARNHLEVALNPVARTLDITVSNPDRSEVYTTQVVYDVGDYVAGDVLGWRRGAAGRMYIDNFTVQQDIAPIPEPAGLGLVGLALIGLRRRRRSQPQIAGRLRQPVQMTQIGRARSGQ